MPRKRIEFIEEYLCPNGDYHEYQYHDNHGTLVRCKNCKHADTFQPDCTEVVFPLKCLSVRYGGVYPDWYCEHGELKEDNDAPNRR